MSWNRDTAKGKFNAMKRGKTIKFTPHAKEKLNRLVKMHVTEEKVVETIKTLKALKQAISDEKLLKQVLHPSLC